MVSEAPLIQPLAIDSSAVQSELGRVDSWINTITSKWAKTKRLIMKEGRTIMRGIGSIIISLKMTMQAVGMTLDPAMEAIFTMLSTTVTAMTSITMAYSAGGPLGWVSAGLAAAGLVIALGAQAQSLITGEEVKRDMDASMAAINSWSTTFSAFAGIGTWTQ